MSKVILRAFAAGFQQQRLFLYIYKCRYAYSADQLEYHYTKDKAVLQWAVAAQQQQQQGASHTGSASG
jgi:hypothetical protein